MIEWPLTDWSRLGLLIALLIIAAGAELLLRRQNAIRWKEYSFLGIGLLVGAIFGILVDQLTSRLSPEYFLYLKGLDEYQFQREIIELGAKAGLSAGAVTASLLLIAKTYLARDSPFRIGRLCRLLFPPLAHSVVAAGLLGLGFRVLVPDSVVGPFLSLLEPAQVAGFKTVIGAHYGLYLGGLVGTLYSVHRIRNLS